ncbi:helix-turn-helix domain-containing protein [Thiorhodovibrio litoralis]|nr:helix-turn-helix transcriptional regulator [Thiorhodovibrio litoralis]MBK5967330.1 hypothetical protein [Thiorhodovibrio winogradskyi]WPL13308.1 hypothetical protein Thiosp_03107 [Thiorhodovibrio litoralis]
MTRKKRQIDHNLPIHKLPPLLRLIMDAGQSQGLGRAEICKKLGIAPSYLSALILGRRPIDGLSLDILRRAAELIERSTAEMLMLAGTLSVEDYFTPAKDKLDAQLDAAWHQVPSDALAGFVPAEGWSSLDRRQRTHLIMLAERHLGQDLVEKARSISSSED